MSQNKYLKVPIKGMHCRSCEILIEEKLREVNHVKSANLNYKTSEAVIHYREIAPDMNDIKKAIAEAGYEIGESEKLPFLSRNKNDYANLGNAFLIIAILYLLLKNLGLMNLNVTSDLSSPGFGLIVLIGLVAGFSTCMALVGGLVLGLSTKFAENHPSATVKEKFKPHIFFVIGRILSYAFLGGLLGTIGKIFQVSPLINGLLTLLVGIVMLIMGLQLIDIFPRLSKLKLSLPKGLSRFLGISKKPEEYSHRNSMILGGLTFFLPCGFTQAMQLYAISTGSFGAGALVMGLFALGTAPGLLSIGGLTSIVQGSFKELFFKVAGLAVIFFAVFNLNNGYSLTSLSAAAFVVNSFNAASNQPPNNINDPNVILENGVQVIHMTENSNGYSPNRFSIKKGVPVKWIVEAKAPYSCASVLLIPKLKIQKFLVAGENIIEFTPTESGQLPFSCSMGMYTGVFNVYDGDSASVNSNATVGVNTALAATNSGTCGGGGGGCGCGGGVKKPVNTNSKPVVAETTQDTTSQENIQIIKTTYTAAKYLDPSIFKVKAGVKVRLEIEVRDNGSGCGYAITIPGLYDNIKPLQANVPIVMEFTPTTPGSYDITCGMGMIRFGSITVE